MTGKDQVARLLALVPYLQAHPGASLEETAQLFGITARQLRADLDIVFMCGLPGLMPGDMIDVDMEAVDGDGVIFLDNADVLSRPLRLTADEAASLVLALNAVGDLGDSATTAAVASALAKLQAALGETPGAGTLEVATAATDVRDAITAAIADSVRLRLRYDGPQRTTEPLVEPARTIVRDGVAYLQAWSVQRADWRLFRLERIAAATVTAEPFDPREAPEVPRSWADQLGDAGEVSLELAPEAAWAAEYYPVRECHDLPDGGVRVRLGVADPAWLDALLLRLGPGVRACEPASAADGARRRARQALGHYR